MESAVRNSHLFSLFLVFAIGSVAGAPAEGDVRLVGPADHMGTVGVFHNGQWGTICDDSWNYRDADVVCRELGYLRSYRIYYRAYFGQGEGPVLIDQINCPNNAQSLLECAHEGWGEHDCKKSEDAGVECYRLFPRKPASDEMPVMVSCPGCTQWGNCTTCSKKTSPSPTDCEDQVAVEGFVFAQYENEWHPVTAEGWDIRDAQVVCGEMGYPVAFPVPTMAEVWTNWDGKFLEMCGSESGLLMGPGYPKCDIEGIEQGSGEEGLLDGLCTEEELDDNAGFRAKLGKTLLRNVQCVGNEKRLLDCYFPSFGPQTNPSHNVARVKCGFKPHSSCATSRTQEIYRVRGAAVPWEGRVEVRVNGVWGTICDTDWGKEEANIVCKALGYGSPVRQHFRAFYGRGVGTIHYSNLRCVGNEATLGECAKKSTGSIAQGCGHQGDAGVECTRPTPCTSSTDDTKIARLTPRPQQFHPQFSDEYVEVKGSAGWGSICRSHLTLAAATIICRSERQLFAIQMRSGNYNHTRYTGTLNCTGEEASLDECGVVLEKVDSCDGGEAIVDCTTSLPDLVPDVETISRSLSTYPYVDIFPNYLLECSKEENCLSSSANGQGPNDRRLLLRFDSLTMNWGTTDFLPNQQRHEWQFHTCHNHFHSFEAFIHYDLLNFTSGEKVAEGHKASFCLEDSLCRSGITRFRCSSGIQGISANCGDLYGRHLDCQWIDVTDVKPGFYILRLSVNPDLFVAESDHGNNEVRCAIELTLGNRLNYYWCRLSDH